MRYFSRQFFTAFVVAALIAVPALGQRSAAVHARAVITAQQLKLNINFLASDSMKGRLTPSPELDRAAEFIANQFKLYGLQPVNGSFFQDLNYCNIDLGEGNFISLVDGLQTKNFELKDDFVPYDFSGCKAAEAEVVFVGYGITAPEFSYDDYKDIDVAGKIVVAFRQEPGQSDTLQRGFDGRDLTRYSSVREKQKIAQEHGAKALLIVSGPLNYSSLKPRAFAWPSLSKGLPKGALPIGYCGRETEVIPVVQIGDSIVRELFGGVDSLRNMQTRIDATMHPSSFPVRRKTMALNIALATTPVGGRNVIAWLEGSDPGLKNEVLVIGAHYDHVGSMSIHKADTDYIYNGADDNASGTSGVLAVAKAFGSMSENPKRSVLFMAFAGEEKGLLGSASYVRKPLWPLEQTVAMLNLDMISRNSIDSVELVGARLSPGLVKIVRKANREEGMVLTESTSPYLDGGSDHASFFRKGIPALFFFAGFHSDYHEVTDNPDRINAEKAARISRLAFLSAWQIANEKKHYKIVSTAVAEAE